MQLGQYRQWTLLQTNERRVGNGQTPHNTTSRRALIPFVLRNTWRLSCEARAFLTHGLVALSDMRNQEVYAVGRLPLKGNEDDEV